MNEFQRYLEFHKDLAEAQLKVVSKHLKGVKPVRQKSTSNIDTVEKVLKAAGRPLHISEIIEIARKDFNVHLQRDSVVSNLVKKIRAGQSFKRTAPNTFALME